MIFLFLIAVVIFIILNQTAKTPENKIILKPTPAPTVKPKITPKPTPKPIEFDVTKFPAPERKPYYINKSGDIWYAVNPYEYIMNDNVIVKYFADSITLKENGNELQPTFADDFTPYFSYQTDVNGDYWQYPDYYIYGGFVGDCEDYALVWASVFEYWKIPYMVVGGYDSGQRDWVIEFTYQNKKYRGQVQYGMWEIDHYPVTFTKYIMFNKNTGVQYV